MRLGDIPRCLKFAIETDQSAQTYQVIGCGRANGVTKVAWAIRLRIIQGQLRTGEYHRFSRVVENI